MSGTEAHAPLQGSMYLSPIEHAFDAFDAQRNQQRCVTAYTHQVTHAHCQQPGSTPYLCKSSNMCLLLQVSRPFLYTICALCPRMYPPVHRMVPLLVGPSTPTSPPHTALTSPPRVQAPMVALLHALKLAQVSLWLVVVACWYGVLAPDS